MLFFAPILLFWLLSLKFSYLFVSLSVISFIILELTVFNKCRGLILLPLQKFLEILMKKSLFTILILLMAACFPLFADGGKAIKIVVGDKNVEYAIADIQSIKYSDDAMIVCSKSGVSDSWELSFVNKIFIDNKGVVNTTSVAEKSHCSMTLLNNGRLSYSFAKPTLLRVYSIAGRIVEELLCNGSGEIDFAVYGKGSFVVYAAGRTLKITNR